MNVLHLRKSYNTCEQISTMCQVFLKVKCIDIQSPHYTLILCTLCKECTKYKGNTNTGK